MALGDPYATLAQLKRRLSISDSDTRDDDILTAALDAATEAVTDYCDRQFNLAEETSARTYRPRTRTGVDTDDIATTTGLVVDVDDTGDGTYSRTIAASDYVLEPLEGVVQGVPGHAYTEITLVTGCWPLHRRPSIRVTATWGWPAVPARVREATLIVAAELARLKDAPFGVSGFTEFGIMRVRDNPFASRLLQRLRRDPVKVA